MGYSGRFDGDLAQRSSRDALIDELVVTYRLDRRLVVEALAEAERAAAEDPRGRSAVDWFKRLAGISVTEPAPGRRTRVQATYGGPAPVARSAGASPGKVTRTMTLAAYVEAARQRDLAQKLPAPVQSRMSELFGVDFSRVQVHADSAEATGSTRAVARGEEIHFREGAYQPGTPEGDRVIAHELAHLVQQRGGRAGPDAPRRELEREADVAAALVARGQPARIRLRAAAGAYAFSDDEDHDVDAGELEARPREGEDEDHAPRRAADQRGEPDRQGVDETRAPDRPEVDSEPRDRSDQAGVDQDDRRGVDGNADSNADGAESKGDLRRELASVGGDPVAAEESAPGGAPAGGGAAPKPIKEAPAVASAPPEAAFGQLVQVRPDKLAAALPQVRTAASADVAKARAKAQASPPRQLSTGESAALSARKGASQAASEEKGGAPNAPRDVDDRPVKPELAGEQAAKEARQQEAAQAQRSAGQTVLGAAQASTQHFSSISSGSADGDATAMSEADAEQMAGSIDRLSADLGSIETDPGPPPTIAMKGEARSSADGDRAELEDKAAGAETQAHADSRVPMGEDDIETTVPTEELTAQPVKGPLPEAALPTVAGAASSEDVGIIAQEQHQVEIDAALGRASSDVAGERARHEQADLQARADSDRQIRELKTQADGEQDGARRIARTEVDRARGEWQGEIDKKGVEARAKADKKIADGMVEVESEEEKANTEAREHIDEGKKKADQEKQKGEREAEEAKKKGQEKSSGFWGWVKSKAKALVDGIKKAISAVIDIVRKAIKVVIEAAKKLAMAAIELARKAIVAVIEAIGKALLALTEVLLAAFPELKARFQKAIRGLVDKAVETVNKVAEGLKKAVQKALDLLGAALDKALGLLEKGLHAIVDAVGAVIQAAIKAAEAVANMLGVWVKLIKDVAASPGSWIGKLGAAVVDGIKNHLWTALKSAVIDWFQSKVFELLGLGGLVLQILLDSGVTTGDITDMAIQALIIAIPVILVTILIEKLVSMIVPAAGAVMAIIEGLVAAWGTISRIIAAFAAFVAFLLAVKGGGAGPLFAGLLAAAAVVVLDFIANWLLRKLAGPARKVGKRLEKMAEKFKARGKGKPSAKDGPDGKAPAKDRDDDDGDPVSRPRGADRDGRDAKDGRRTHRPDRPSKRPSPGGRSPMKGRPRNRKDPDGQKRDSEETLAQKEARLRAAVMEVKQLSRSGRGLGVLYRARLWGIRRKHRLTELAARRQPGKGHIYDIRAAVNPRTSFETVAIEDDASDLRVAIARRFESHIGDRDVTRQQVEALIRSVFAETLGTGQGYRLILKAFDDRIVAFVENSKAEKPHDHVPVGAAVQQDDYDDGTNGPGGYLIYTNARTGTQYVRDAADQYVPRRIVRSITAEDAHFLKVGEGLIPKNDPLYQKKFKFTSKEGRAREPRDHVMGAKLSPYISATKQLDGRVHNPDGEPFDTGLGKVAIDLAFVNPKNIFDLGTRKGQASWSFSDPSTDKTKQALRDVVRTSEVLVRGRIPAEAISEVS